MFICHSHDRFASSVFASLAIAATVAIAALSYAIANIQIVA